MSEREDAGDAGTAGAIERPDGSDDAVEELRAAAEDYRAAQDAIDDVGREVLETLDERYRTANDLLVEYQDKATDTGAKEFVQFATFKQRFTDHVEGLDDDLPRREAFEAALETVDKTRLSEDDFQRALDALEPAAALVERLADESAARDRLFAAISDARAARQAHQDAVDRCERLLELGEADLDAPIEELREPIDRWNEAVRDAIDDYRTDVPARDFFDLLERTERYPLVELDPPPEELAAYVVSAPAGEESVARLLEFADYSRSKLDHYVEDPDAFRRAVATERTYLERLDAAGLTVDWPPPPADEVPWLVRELRGAAGGLVGDDAVSALREFATLARDRERYARLRDAAVARGRLDAEARERLADGSVEAELAEHREAIERIDEALEAAPDP
jgi:tetratricopeptide (TPR) repeat protein